MKRNSALGVIVLVAKVITTVDNSLYLEILFLLSLPSKAVNEHDTKHMDTFVAMFLNKNEETTDSIAIEMHHTDALKRERERERERGTEVNKKSKMNVFTCP